MRRGFAPGLPDRDARRALPRAASRPGGRSREATGRFSSRRAPRRSTAPTRGTACSTTSSKRWRSRRACPSPPIYVIPDPDPNAFATGQRPGAGLDRRDRGPAREARPRRAAGGRLARDRARQELRRAPDDRGRGAGRRGPAALGLEPARACVGPARRSSRGGGGGARILFVVLWIVSIVLAPIIAQIVVVRRVSRSASTSRTRRGRSSRATRSGWPRRSRRSPPRSSPRPRSSRGSPTCASRTRAGGRSTARKASSRICSRPIRRSKSGSPLSGRWPTRRRADGRSRPVVAARPHPASEVAPAVEEDSQIREVAGLEGRRRQLRSIDDHGGHRMVEPQTELHERRERVA